MLCAVRLALVEGNDGIVSEHSTADQLGGVMLAFLNQPAIKRKYISALLGGRPSGYLAEFFSGSTVFPNKDIAFSVLEQSMPLLFKLSGRVADEKVYADIVSECIGRILRI